MDFPFIDDGYNRRVKIKGIANFTPDVVLTYRPFAGPGSVNAEREIATTPQGEERVAKSLEILCGQMLDWDITEKGEPTKPTPAMMRRLPSETFNRIYTVVFGYAAPDEDLTGNDPVSDKELEATDAGN